MVVVEYLLDTTVQRSDPFAMAAVADVSVDVLDFPERVEIQRQAPRPFVLGPRRDREQRVRRGNEGAKPPILYGATERRTGLERTKCRLQLFSCASAGLRPVKNPALIPLKYIADNI